MALWGIAGALTGLLGGLGGLAGAAAAAGKSYGGSSGGSSGSGGGGSASTAPNEHLRYLDQTYAGGSSAYIRSQQQRYEEAQRTGNLDLVSRLQADAARVGYMLPGYTPSYSGGGGASASPTGPASPGGGGSGSGFNLSEEAKAYLNQNYTGGWAGYVNSQINRYIEAVGGGDLDLQQRLLADAARVGYQLPSQETAYNIALGRQQPAPPPPQYRQPKYEQPLIDFSPFFDELQRIAQGIDAETAPIVSQAYEQIMGMINNTEQSLIQRYTELGQGVDPATQAALASLKQTVQQERQKLMEEMSRRGLLQSGIWLEMEDRLQQGLLTEQQRLVATRLSDLQNQLNQALMNLEQSRIQATSQFGSEQVRLAEAAAQRRQQALSDLARAAMEAQKQMLEQQREAQRLAWEQEKFYAPWTMGPTPEQMLPYQYPTANTMVPYEYGPTPAQMLPYQYPTANALLPYEYGLTPYQREQLDLGYARLNQAGAGTSQSDIIRQNLADAQTEIWGMLNSGVPLDQVEAMIWKNAGKYTSSGLKASDLADYAWMAATGYPKPKDQEEW